MDHSIIWTGLTIFALLGVSAFFSGSETALTAASRARIHRLSKEGSGKPARAAARVEKLMDNPESLIGAILLGNNLVNILAASLATSLFLRLFGESAVPLATLAMTVLVLIFAEVTPKTYAITSPEYAALRVAKPISFFVRLSAPFVYIVRQLAALLLRMFGIKVDTKSSMLAAQDEIRGAIDLHHAGGAVIKDDRDMLLAAMDLKDRDVQEIMIHRRNIQLIDADLPPAEILQECLQSPYTRLPIYKENPENIIGVIHAKDLLRAVNDLARNNAGNLNNIDQLDVTKVAMEPWFVPETTSLSDQMQAFLRRRTHFALVIDEYGALQGLVTLEDILEEIVGEIKDEHDEMTEDLTEAPDKTITVEGTATIRDLNRRFEWDLPDEEASTIAGLVIHEAQSIPGAGQIFHFYGFRFEIIECNKNQITRIKIIKL